MAKQILTQPILLSCPCCSKKAKLYKWILYRIPKYSVGCTKCGITTKLFTYAKAAYNSWNNRYS